jgi:hypothetical protein
VFYVASVYVNPDHEFYRQWVAVTDDEDERDEGIQGYLRISVAVLGPGDKIKVHSDADMAAGGIEHVTGKDASSASALQLLIPPTVKQDLHFFVITIHKVSTRLGDVVAAEWSCAGWQVVDLPKMDFGALGFGQGIDAYGLVKFAGGQLKTKAITINGRELLHGEINEQVLPVLRIFSSPFILHSLGWCS